MRGFHAFIYIMHVCKYNITNLMLWIKKVLYLEKYSAVFNAIFIKEEKN